jgi:hypothetical protein
MRKVILAATLASIALPLQLRLLPIRRHGHRPMADERMMRNVSMKIAARLMSHAVWDGMIQSGAAMTGAIIAVAATARPVWW